METSETNSALLTHVPVPDDEVVVDVDAVVGAVVTVAVLVGGKGVRVSVGIGVLMARVAVFTCSTGVEFGNEQADTAIKMDRRKI